MNGVSQSNQMLLRILPSHYTVLAHSFNQLGVVYALNSMLEESNACCDKASFIFKRTTGEDSFHHASPISQAVVFGRTLIIFCRPFPLDIPGCLVTSSALFTS